MSKVKVTKRSIRTSTYTSWRPVAKPKIHSIDQSVQVELRNSSANNPEGSKNETNANRFKYLSVAIHIVALAALSYVIILDTSIFIQRPTGTGVEDDMYAMEKIDFPGVAICDLNIISREAAMILVEKIWAEKEVQSIRNMTRERIQQLITYMGHLILFETEETVPGDLMLFSKILEIFLKTDNIVREMEDLSPKCGSFMKNCYWQGPYHQCHGLFTQRWTQDGFCCAFNYVKWSDSISSHEETDFRMEVERSKFSGQSFGLKVHMRPQLDDQFYSILPGHGYKVLVYTTSDYPDAPSGGVREILITPGTENFVNLRAISFHSSPDVIQYDKSKRNCLFSTEMYEIYNGFYSYSQCMMLCRVRDIYKICGCIPFFYPTPHDIRNVTKCMVSDLTCLKKHRYKWWSVKPENTNLNGNPYKDDIEGELNENLDCDCLPTCETVSYWVFKSGSSITNLNQSHLSGKIKQFTKDDVILTLSFQTTSAVRLRQDALFHWYDLLSNYGGLCSLFLGISIITPIEFLYLFCERLWSRWRKNYSVKKQRLPAKIELRERSIYWKEIIPLE